MLKKKKQNVYFRFGLKPQQGVIVAAYVLPRDEFKNLLTVDFYGDYNTDRTRNQLELIITTSGKKNILLDNKLGVGNVYGADSQGLTQIPILITDPDKAAYGGLGFLVYINEKKEVVYRYPGGSISSLSGESTIETGPATIYDPPVFIDGIETVQRTPIETTINGSTTTHLNIKEKKISLLGEAIDGGEESLYTKYTTKSSRSKKIGANVIDSSGASHTVYGYGTEQLAVGGSDMTFAFSPMGSIFIANHSWEYDQEADEGTYNQGEAPPAWPRSTKSFDIIDKDGDYTQFVEDGDRPTKLFSTRPDNGEAVIYWQNWSSYDEAWPTVLKANDKEDFLMMPSDGPAFIIKDEDKYVLQPGSFDINGSKYEVGNFYPQFFATENMMHQRRKNFGGEVGWKRYGFHGAWDFGSWRERAYTTYSWFGNYIYRIRIDELIDEPLFSQNPIDVVTANYPNNPQPEIDYMLGFKEKAKVLGFKPGAFFLDVLNNAATDQQMKDLVSFIGIAGGINNFLKIYQPETDKLWIEKFQIEYTPGQAKIVFKERFLNPFYTPLNTGVLGTGDWDIDTLEKYIPALKSICYVPYD